MPEADNKPVNRWVLLWLLGILGITLIAYLPAFVGEFTNWDDNRYVTENRLLRQISLSNLETVFFRFFDGNYHPLTLLSLMADYHLGGLDARVFHTTNIALHLITTAGVFWLILLLAGDPRLAALATVLFGVHPLHVESVAWISERKDVLYALFFVASLIAYVHHVRKGGLRHYLLALLLFLLSLLSKGQAVSLSVALVAVDFLLKRKLLDRRVVLEKVPFFALSLVFGIVAVLAQKASDFIADPATYTALDRAAFASYGYVQYLLKLILPLDLSAYYPYPGKTGGAIPWTFWLYPPAVAALFVGFLFCRKRSRLAAFGILFFTLNIFQVLQLLPVGNAIMADRYSYVPSIGFFLLVGAAYRGAVLRFRPGLWLIRAGVVGYVVFLTVCTYNRCGVWKDSLTLWSDVLSRYPDVPVALNNRGLARYGAGDLHGAMVDFNRSIRLESRDGGAYHSRGLARARLGDLKGAVEDFDQALRLRPGYAIAYSNRGLARSDLKDFVSALSDLNKAIQLAPDLADAYLNRGVVRFNSGDAPGAVADFSRVIRLEPGHARAHFNRGYARVKRGQKEEGYGDLRKAHDLGHTGALEQIRKFEAGGR